MERPVYTVYTAVLMRETRNRCTAGWERLGDDKEVTAGQERVEGSEMRVSICQGKTEQRRNNWELAEVVPCLHVC